MQLNLSAVPAARHALSLVAVCCLFTFMSSAWAEARQLEVIPLQHRPPELIVPTLQGIAHQDAVITASGNQLVIRATASEMTQLKTLIQQLDQPLAQFRISVRQSGQNSQNHSSGGLKVGRITLDGKPLPSSGVHISDGGNNNSSTVTVRQYRTRGNSDTTQQLRAVEGYPAYIETGQQIPFLAHYHDRYGASVEQSYQPVVTGFYVTLTAAGSDRVTLDIATAKQSVEDEGARGRGNQAIKTAAYQSTVSAPLGEWIDLGSSLEGGSSRSSGIVQRRSVTANESFNVQLKIERSP